MAHLLFVSNGVFENLGIEYLSAFLKKNGHKVSLLIDPTIFSDTFRHCSSLAKIFDFESIILDNIVSQKADVVCFSVLTDTYQWALNFAKEIKRHLNILIIFGGIHPTLLPDLVIKNKAVDIVCIGEGEIALLELANSLDKGVIDYGIKNLWFKKDGKIIKNSLHPVNKDLDALPFPDKDIFYNINNHHSYEYLAISGRGCPFNCSYCCNHAMRILFGENYVRKRSVESLIAELAYAKSKYRIRYVWFMDDIFILNKKWLRNFSKKYTQEIKIPFFCYLHPEQIDEEVLELLKTSGCYEVGIGVQTLSLKAKKVVERFESIEKIEKAIKLIKRTGMLVVTENIAGLPYETERDLLKLVRFYNNTRPALVIMNWLRLFPKTDLLAFEREKGLLNDNDFEKIEQGRNTQVDWEENTSNHGIAKKIVILLEALPCLPVNIVDIIVKKRLYRFIPCWSKYINYFMRILHFSPLGKLFYGESTYDSGARIYVRNYFYFIFKKLLIFLRGKGSCK